MTVRKYSKRTIESYLYWIEYFIVFNNKQHPDKLGAKEVEAFLTQLVVNRRVSSSTQSIPLNALVFLKTKFLQQELAPLADFNKSTRQSKLPVVLTKVEVTALLAELSGKYYLMAALLYGSGLRRMEMDRLRVKDVDFDYKQLRVIFGKGAKHRAVALSEQLLEPLRQ